MIVQLYWRIHEYMKREFYLDVYAILNEYTKPKIYS